MQDWQNAKDAAQQCVKINKAFIKGHHRLANALVHLETWDAAMSACNAGLCVEPVNPDLKRIQREAETGKRNSRVVAYISAARQQHAAGDFVNAFKTLENALRLDERNSTAQQLMENTVRPDYLRAEQTRRAGLNRVELIKEEADDLVRNASFEDAITKYNQCIDALHDAERSGEFALKCFGNRALCYKQLSNFDMVIGDTTHIIETQPQNVKALVRRAQAFEAMERYRLSLQDVTTVLALPMQTVGSSNFSLASGMRHRLQKCIEKMRQEN
jgi:stress-induced-phosphoprotein 1